MMSETLRALGLHDEAAPGRSGAPTRAPALLSIADTIKRHARGAGLDPERISPHSLRAGHVTEAK